MKSINKYNIVAMPVSGNVFEDAMNSRISNGFQPYGSPFFTRDRAGHIIGHQVVVKYDNKFESSSEQISDSPGPAESSPSDSRGGSR